MRWRTTSRVAMLGVLVWLGGIVVAHAIEVTIIDPATPLMVKNQKVPWKCSVEGAGDQAVIVTWTWYDGTGDVQEGARLFEVEHEVTNSGQFLMKCEVYDPESEDTDTELQTFRVLWVIYCLSKGATSAVDLDNNAAEDYHYGWGRPHTIDLGFLTGVSGFRYCLEFYGTTHPLDWGSVIPQYENPVDLHRRFGPLGGRTWQGPDGDQLEVAHDPDEDDTSHHSARDDEPQSTAIWDMDSPYQGTYPSAGCVYDIDRPGHSQATGICRIRANFIEWAQWQGQRCSDELEWYIASSCRWNAQTEEWELVDDVGGQDNSSDETHLSSVDWDLED